MPFKPFHHKHPQASGLSSKIALFLGHRRRHCPTSIRCCNIDDGSLIIVIRTEIVGMSPSFLLPPIMSIGRHPSLSNQMQKKKDTLVVCFAQALPPFDISTQLTTRRVPLQPTVIRDLVLADFRAIASRIVLLNQAGSLRGAWKQATRRRLLHRAKADGEGG